MTSARRKLERQQRKKQGAAGSRGQPSKVTDIQLRELEAILARAKAGPLGDAEVDKLKAAMDTLAFLTRELEAKGASNPTFATHAVRAEHREDESGLGLEEGCGGGGCNIRRGRSSEHAGRERFRAGRRLKRCTARQRRIFPRRGAVGQRYSNVGRLRAPPTRSVKDMGAILLRRTRVPRESTCRTKPCTTRRRAPSASEARCMSCRPPHSSCACAAWRR